ncbi:MAG: hypothetical protein RLZZ493_906 [Bacteroidota bacterium]
MPFLAFSSIVFGQQSEDFIPKDAVTVFSLNNISILQKVSMDELVSYDFMTALQSELFDGSTAGKSFKDSGIDFNQKMNIFYGKNADYELSGFTFGITDKEKLFTVFDDFDRLESIVPGVEYYNNYFNHLMIRGNIGVLLRVDGNQEKFSEIADSLWLARGNKLPWMNEGDDYYEGDDLPIEAEGNLEDAPEEGEIVEEVIETPMEETPVAVEDDVLKNYYELRDSLESEYALVQLQQIVEELFMNNVNLKQNDPRLAAQLTHTSEGIFYLDNSRNFQNSNNFGYFKMMFPDLYKDLRELYVGNVLLGDIALNAHSIDIDLQANYGEKLGEIYHDLSNAKFDKKVLDYIPASNSGFFTYNIDLKKGYEKAYEVILPILSHERNPRISANVLMLELINEFVNTDEVFNTYKGSMFGTFNGIKRVKTKRIDFFYDEQTFEYGEREVESEEDMPIFTLGFSTARPDVPNKVLNHMARLTSQFKNMGDYWVYEDAILNSVPLYMINKNGLFIFTNDEDLAKNHSNGYGKNAVGKKQAHAARKSGSMYGFVNMEAIINDLPREMFTDKRFELLESMKGKQGEMVLTSSKTTKENTVYHLTYSFNNSFENGGKYLLDLINSAYILSRQ